MKTFVAFAVLSVATLLVVVGCDNEAESTRSAAPAATPVAAASLPAGMVVTAAPAGAQDLDAVKKSAKDGDAVVVNAWIGGADEPMAKNRAMMTVADVSLPSCDKTPMDTCKTPWDSCCEAIETRTAKTATVQVVDAAGKPLAGTLENVAGLKPLSKVTVAGIARRPAGSETLVIEAKQIHVTQ
ncbi:MAG: hypothetical protein QOF78_1447 [Phycisphaerales bacterium]|jgi:hypothetical protein|nr:hypothetical protein [Phycisphaerales bacterium]